MAKLTPPRTTMGCGNPNCRVCGPNADAPRDYSELPEGARPTEDGIAAAFGRLQEALGRANGGVWDAAAAEAASRDGFGGTTTVRFTAPSADDKPNAIPRPLSKKYLNARNAIGNMVHDAPEQGFDDIIGNSEALAQLREAIEAPVKSPELYRAYGMRPPRGALLVGPPGCGKTMFARAAASEMSKMYDCQVEYVLANTADLMSKFVGDTEKRIKKIFDFARVYHEEKGHPLLVFMDEAEALLPDRTGRHRPVHSWEQSQVATFLSEMDGMNKSGAFVLLASNRPEAIDQAVLRDGRCDFKIMVNRPGRPELEQIVSRGLTDMLVCLGEDTTVDQLAEAAAEAFCDPHKIITHATAVKSDGSEQITRNLTLEHIASGAMAASVPQRASRRAFMRDRAAGATQPSGVVLEDVLESVNDIFQENLGLDHSYAMPQVVREIEDEIDRKGRGRLN